MIYLSGTYSATLASLAADLPVGLMAQPKSGLRPRLREFRWWAADNGCFAQGEAFELEVFFDWLDGAFPYRSTCLFAVAPDVVGDAAATLRRALPALPIIRARGFRVAYVAQDGFDAAVVPWDEIGCLFIGGSTAWKLSREAAAAAAEAKRRGKWVHVGRVNSEKRLRFAHSIGADSADGNFLLRAPDANVARLRRWFEQRLLPMGVAA